MVRKGWFVVMNNGYRQPWFTKAINYAISSEQPLKTSTGDFVYVTSLLIHDVEDSFVYNVRIANGSDTKEVVCFDFLLNAKKWLWEKFDWNEEDIL